MFSRRNPASLTITIVSLLILQANLVYYKYVHCHYKTSENSKNNQIDLKPVEQNGQMFYQVSHDGEAEKYRRHNTLHIDNTTSIYFDELDSTSYICCYRNPNNPVKDVGRPFKVTDYVKKYWLPYMKHKPMRKHQKHKFTPTPVTACSSNHFREHLTHADRVAKFFPDHKIVFYDIGLSPAEAEWVKNNPRYVYKKFNFDQYPPHVSYLKNYSWKILIWADVLQSYGSIVWFDSSIWFWNGTQHWIQEKIIKQDSCFLYYIKEAAHDISSHTHPNMYGYFPSDMSQHSAWRVHMKMAGAIVIYNDIDCHSHILKWAILCALTRNCIDPPSARKQCPPTNSYIYNQEKFSERKDGVKYPPKPGQELELKPFLLCHRYDQALMSVLIENFYKFESGRFFLSAAEQIAKPWRTGNDESISGRMRGDRNASKASAEGALAEIKLIEVKLKEIEELKKEVMKRDVSPEVEVKVDVEMDSFEVDMKNDKSSKHDTKKKVFISDKVQ